ncbi:hypothetical protein bcgnr5369_21290 [Bacillus cereus]
MDNMFYQEITQEESFKYACHYFSIYKSKIRQHNLDFNHHYDYDCDFNKSFFENIVFGNDFFLDLFKENQNKLIKQGTYDLNEVMELNEQFKKETLATFMNDFKTEFVKEYITKINDILKEHNKELKYAIEDEKFYQNREYLNHKEFLDDPVSEEERTECIQDAKEKQEDFKVKIELYESAKNSIANSLSNSNLVSA